MNFHNSKNKLRLYQLRVYGDDNGKVEFNIPGASILQEELKIEMKLSDEVTQEIQEIAAREILKFIAD